MNDTQYRPVNYVANEPGVVMPRADVIRRQDVIDQVSGLVTIYQEQQRAALAGMQQDVGRNGYLSSAEQVKERRATSRMYLVTYGVISGMTMAGLVILAALAGALNTPMAFGAWLVGTGLTTAAMAWIRHGDELKLWPESIARHVVDAHWDLSAYEAETRRLSLQWEYRAEARRQQAAAQASADAREQARLRMEEIDARRRLNEARFQPPVEVQTEYICNAVDEPTPSTWQADLLQWVSSLFTDDGMTSTGVIKGRVPWAQRSEWAPADKEAARRVCCSLRPALIVQADGGRWRVKLELADNAETALRILTPRLQAD